MGDLTYKLSDLYAGYSLQSTSDTTLPDAADLEKLPAADTTSKVEAVTEVTTSNANKKQILLAVGVIAGVALLFGILKG